MLKTFCGSVDITSPDKDEAHHFYPNPRFPKIDIEETSLFSVVKYVSVVAVCRIDNRTDLADLLGLDDRISDEKLIAYAYLRWGENCLQFLLGDFAFYLWDSKKQCVFCARDHIGVKSFYYSCYDNIFYFSSSIEGLLGISKIPKEINQERIVDYFSSICVDNCTTFYKHIRRLPPAHFLLIENGSVKTQRYWTVPSSTDVRPRLTVEECSEFFRQKFFKAVGSRVNTPDTAIFLSGGLDSTAIACVAEREYQRNNYGDLPVYSGVFERFKECDERDFINETLKCGKFEWDSIVADNIDPLESLFEIASIQKEPWFTPHLFMKYHLLKAMSRKGITVVMDGHDGDSVVSHGWEYFKELIDDSRVYKFFLEVYRAKKTLTHSEQLEFVKIFFHRKFGLPFNRLYNRVKQREETRDRSNRTLPGSSHWLNQDFFYQSFVEERLEFSRKFNRGGKSARDIHFNNMFHPIQPFGLEVLNKTAAAFDIEYRFPFWDKDLVEFCLRLPAEQKFRDGWPRSILRRGMEGVIPARIQWRKDKTDFMPNMHSVTELLFENQAGVLVSECQKNVEQWVDLKKMIEYYRSNPDKKSSAVFDLWKVLTLHAWIETQKLN